jgi:putative glycosyltransferase (TIGR04372 family)
LKNKLFKLSNPLIIIAIPLILVLRLISPLICIRIGKLISSRIGHLVANTELYLCEKDAKINTPKHQRYIDIFYLGYKPICNFYLVQMWRRKIHIFSRILLEPLHIANKIIPFSFINEVPDNQQEDRDILNLLEIHSPHLIFTQEEEEEGKTILKSMGIKYGDKFVCLIVRDSAYLEQTNKNLSWQYHNYRDCDINNYKITAEFLTKQGYFVIRMGANTNQLFETDNPQIIDYATNGMRSEFMDIYLGAKCTFCISSSLGWDSIPEIFNRPIVYTNILPIGYLRTSSKKSINLSKHFVRIIDNKELNLSEIFSDELGFLLRSEDYFKRGIKLVENSSEEILDVVKEMIELINNNFILNEELERLQKYFWKKFPVSSLEKNNHRPLHGKINAIYSSTFLKKNPNWLN